MERQQRTEMEWHDQLTCMEMDGVWHHGTGRRAVVCFGCFGCFVQASGCTERCASSVHGVLVALYDIR
ncbi:unnamed protein product [Lampetra planeri]